MHRTCDYDTDGLWYFQAEAVAQAATVRQQRAEDELQRIREELVRVLSTRLVVWCILMADCCAFLLQKGVFI
jgi:hypothetical protein